MSEMLSSFRGETEGGLMVDANQGRSLQSGDGSSRSTFRIRTTRLALVVTSLHRVSSSRLFISCFQLYQL